MRYLNQLILVLILISLSGCSHSPSEKPISTSTLPFLPTLAATTSKMPTSTMQPTKTIKPTQIKIRNTSTPSIPPPSILNYTCIEIDPQLPTYAKLPGTLVLSGSTSYLLNFAKGSLKEIPGALGYGVSPDGKWLSYVIYEESSNWLFIQAENESPRKLFALENELLFFRTVPWIDKQHIAVNKFTGRRAGYIPPVVIINPFTGETQELPTDYPGYLYFDGLGGFNFGYASAVYDPSLNLVVYPESSTAAYIVLYDRQVKKALAKIQGPNWGHLPLWFPDSLQFVIVTDLESTTDPSDKMDTWFSVSRDGYVRQLTHFQDYFKYTSIENASISPDGHYLAFWLEVRPGPVQGQRLAVMDMETFEVTDYCIPGAYEGIDDNTPVWSPDSRYIAVTNFYEVNSRQSILFDLQEEWAAYIGREEIPVGWLVWER